MTISKVVTAAIIAAACSTSLPASAQFDLSSQRKEIQNFLKVPGHKIDHKGIIINPTPHELTVDSTKSVNIASGFNVESKTLKTFGNDFATLGIPVSKGGLKLKVEVNANKAAKTGIKEPKGSYSLTIDSKGVNIIARENTGAFYALQTLRQLLDSPVAKDKTLPQISVNDWPDLAYRGVVEGFYGNPWSHEVRLSLINFYGRNKMTDYIYGPKDDPYHSSPYWRQPYPEAEAVKIKELVEACKRNHVNFVWAIHPGHDIRWDKADEDSLIAKLNMMYDLGVRSFAVFFDDINGKGTDSNMQTALLNKLNNEFVKSKGDVTNMMICPTDYSQLWANPKPTGQLAVYGNTLDPNIEVFWTGAVVCSDLTPETMEFVNSRIKRPALFWWNFPVTDYCRNILLQGPVYGLDQTLTQAQVAGIESNPMEHGEASKLALYGVADYSWNIAGYNPIDNWERGLAHIAPEATEAYRTFAIHSADTETGYRRDESWETTTFPYNDFTAEEFAALRTEFEKIVKVPSQMQAISNKGLLSELSPWLDEFGKLGARGLRTLDLIKIFKSGNTEEFWNSYVANLMSNEEKEAYEKHKSGTMKLQPFYENSMNGMLYEAYMKLSGKMPSIYRPIGSYRSLASTRTKMMLDNDTTTFFTTGTGQKTGHWVGLDLGEPKMVNDVVIYQGRNSVDDVDYFDNAIVEASIDGKEWQPLTGELTGTYIIKWHGENPVNARYVRMRKLESKKQNWLAIRSFCINPVTADNVGITIKSDNIAGALLAFDNNPETVFNSNGELTFERKKDATEAILLLDTPKANTIIVKQVDDNGKVLDTLNVTKAFNKLNYLPETTGVIIEGHAGIFEIIQK